MGGGIYSSSRRLTRAIEKKYASKSDALTSGLAKESYVTASSEQIFKQNRIHHSMNPYGVTVRESRDSEEHPESVAIIIALDVTGSMGRVPYSLIQNGLPKIMETILNKGIKDPQVMFVAIGDHVYDEAPLQVGQFESSDELMDRWLQNVYLEGRGGCNDGESYNLAWYFAAQHTSIDCLKKRNKKGLLFTIGDEPVLKEIPAHDLEVIMGPGQYTNMSSKDLLTKAQEKYFVFHIHILETGTGSRYEVVENWEKLMGSNVLKVQRHTEVAATIANAIVDVYKSQETSNTDNTTEKPKEDNKILL